MKENDSTKRSRHGISLMTVDQILDELKDRFTDFAFVGNTDDDKKVISFHGDTTVLLGLCEQTKFQVHSSEREEDRYSVEPDGFK